MSFTATIKFNFVLLICLSDKFQINIGRQLMKRPDSLLNCVSAPVREGKTETEMHVYECRSSRDFHGPITTELYTRG